MLNDVISLLAPSPGVATRHGNATLHELRAKAAALAEQQQTERLAEQQRAAGAALRESCKDLLARPRPDNRIPDFSRKPSSLVESDRRTGVSLQEYVLTSDSPRVDRVKHIIRGVRILNPVSKNGRAYSLEAMRRATHLYENAPVRVNHKDIKRLPNSQALYEEDFGHLENVRFTGDGLVGDLKYNPHHALAEKVLHDAETSSRTVGLSHNVTGTTINRGGKIIVEEIVSVISVDIVANPATTNGLFEHSAA